LDIWVTVVLLKHYRGREIHRYLADPLGLDVDGLLEQLLEEEVYHHFARFGHELVAAGEELVPVMVGYGPISPKIGP